MILIFKYVFVCVCWVSLWDALHGWWGLGQSRILGAQVWSQPCFGLCRAEGTDWGAQGGLSPLTTSVRESSYLWGALPIALQTGTCPRTDGSAQIPDLLTMTLGTQGETFANIFSCLPLLSLHSWWTWGDLKALSLPWLSQRSTGSTSTHQDPSATTP